MRSDGRQSSKNGPQLLSISSLLSLRPRSLSNSFQEILVRTSVVLVRTNCSDDFRIRFYNVQPSSCFCRIGRHWKATDRIQQASFSMKTPQNFQKVNETENCE